MDSSIRRFHPLLALFVVTTSFVVQDCRVSLHAAEDTTEVIETVGAVPDFSLADFRGKQHSLKSPGAKAYVVAFLGTECPLAKLYSHRLNQLHEQFKGRGVAFVGVNSNSHDSITELAAFSNRHDLTFPMLKDLGNKIADAFKAERTPEVFLLDADLRVRYSGRIDDQYGVGYARDEPQVNELENAITKLLAGKEIEPSRTAAVGCLIGRVKLPNAESKVTYSKQISRIFQTHCVECHRQGEIAPFQLTEYKEVAGWAETILEVVDQRRMPPWHANPKHGEFVNQRLMTAAEKDLIAEWVENGAPEGDPKDLPTPREFTAGWKLPRDPDLVVSMRSRPFQVPATGTVQYQYFVADPGFKKDTWIQAAEVIPGNHSVVHHAVVFIRAPDGVRQRGVGWLAAYVPGQAYASLPDYRARRVPAGSKLIFQLHYTPVGSPQEDLTRLGLIFADESQVTEEVVTRIVIDKELEIRPGVSNHKIEKTVGSFPQGSKLLGIAPHAHLRGKRFRFELVRKGENEILLDVPQYDFNWQHAYEFATPLDVAGEEILVTGSYDNSQFNLVNPDPNAIVRWGDQTWEEMFLAYFAIAIPRQSPATAKPIDPKLVDAEAKKFLKRLDKNEDGIVRKSEVPDSMRVFAFRRFDKNRDDVLSLEEARAAARERLK